MAAIHRQPPGRWSARQAYAGWAPVCWKRASRGGQLTPSTSLEAVAKRESGAALRWNRTVGCYRRAEKRTKRSLSGSGQSCRQLRRDTLPRNAAPRTFYLAKTGSARKNRAQNSIYRHLVKRTRQSLVHSLLPWRACGGRRRLARGHPPLSRVRPGLPGARFGDEAVRIADALFKNAARRAEALFGVLQKRKNSLLPITPVSLGKLAFLRGDIGRLSGWGDS